MAEAKIKTEPEDPPVIKVEDLVSDSEDSDSVASQPIPKKQKIETITSANELGEGSSTSGISVKTEIKEEPEDNSEYSIEFDETGAVKDEPNTSDEEDDDDFDEDEDQDVEDIEELKFEAEDESLLDKGKSIIKLESREEELSSGDYKLKLTCILCSFTTEDDNLLYLHRKEHAVETEPRTSKNKCPYCQYSTNLSLYLESHVVSKHKWQNDCENKIKITATIYECKLCSYRTLVKRNFNIHTKRCKKRHKLKNQIQKTFNCTLCSYSTLDKSNFNKHEKGCTKKHEAQYEIKSKVTKQKPNSHEHTKSKIPCPYCPYSTIVRQHMERHVISKHKTQNDFEKKFEITASVFKCKLCLYSSLYKININKHVKTCLKKHRKK